MRVKGNRGWQWWKLLVIENGRDGNMRVNEIDTPIIFEVCGVAMHYRTAASRSIITLLHRAAAIRGF